MNVSISLVLIVLALIFCVIAIIGRVPIWIAVLLVILERLLSHGGVR